MEHCALKIRIFLAIFFLNVSERPFQTFHQRREILVWNHWNVSGIRVRPWKGQRKKLKIRWHPYFMMVSRAVVISARGGINQNTSYLSESVIPLSCLSFKVRFSHKFILNFMPNPFGSWSYRFQRNWGLYSFTSCLQKNLIVSPRGGPRLCTTQSMPFSHFSLGLLLFFGGVFTSIFYSKMIL